MNHIDSSLGLAARALTLYAERAEVLASNLANADTPGYHARDIDFRRVLGQERATRSAAGPVPAASTHPRHIAIAGRSGSAGAAALGYRVAPQRSLDGNSVDTALEHSAFAANAVRYQAALRFLDGRVKSLLAALKGQ